MYDDLKAEANPKCHKCGGKGRYADYSEDEWGMVMWIRCPCTKKRRKSSRANAAGEVRRNAVTSTGLLAVSESGDK